jgi:hypothetical protein
MNSVKWLRISFLLMLALGLVTPAVAQAPELNDSQEPGSVLVFHKFIAGTVTSGEVVMPRTEIEISVTCPKGSEPCEQGTDVKLKAHWVCPGSQFIEDKFVCHEINFNLFTTVKGTIYFNPENIPEFSNQEFVPPPPCPMGYLIVWVVNEFDQAIKYDALIGNAVIREESASAGAYNAVPIQAVTTLATGDPTDVDGAGDLDFDGATEYKAVTGQISGTVRYETPNINTFLTLLTLDVRSNQPNNPTFVRFNFFTHDEFLISTATEFICWAELRLTQINGALTEGIVGRKGLFESTEAVQKSVFDITQPPVPVTLLAIIETKERTPTARREYSYSTYNDSVPVVTAFQP